MFVQALVCSWVMKRKSTRRYRLVFVLSSILFHFTFSFIFVPIQKIQSFFAVKQQTEFHLTVLVFASLLGNWKAYFCLFASTSRKWRTHSSFKVKILFILEYGKFHEHVEWYSSVSRLTSAAAQVRKESVLQTSSWLLLWHCKFLYPRFASISMP